MAETRLIDAIVPDVFTAYTAEESIYKARLFKSGVVQPSQAMDGILAGGGETFSLPFWQDIGGTSGDNPSETVTATINNLASKRQVFRKLTRLKAWGTNDLVKVFAGANPLDSLQNMVIAYWANALDMVGISTLGGLFAANLAQNAGDLVQNISAAAGALSVINSDAVIDAQAKLGENGTVGRGDLNGGDFTAIVVHPSTYAMLRKQNAITFMAIGDQTRPTGYYMGMEVIVDRNMPVAAGVYDTYLCKAGALQFGQSVSGYQPTELHRAPGIGFGIDSIYTRRVFGMHPTGLQWMEATVTDNISPTDANILLAANWSRVQQAENLRAVMLRHRLVAV